MFDTKRPYRRIEIDLLFTKIKAEMHTNALKRGGDGLALYIDCYTGKTLRGGDPYDYEHIRSAEEIYNKYKNQLTDLQIAEVVNCQENVGVTLSFINKSKGKSRMEVWLLSHLNKPEFEIDINHTKATLNAADSGIIKIVQDIKFRF